MIEPQFGCQRIDARCSARIVMQPPLVGRFAAAVIRFVCARGVIEIAVLGAWWWLR